MPDPILQVENLRTYFSTEGGVAKAVDGVSFHVNPGETLGIVGESGCGKSVTSLSVMRLIPEPPGRIQEGSKILFRSDRGVEDLTRASEERMREIRGNDIAMIFQEPMTSLNPVFTVGDQIMESLRLHQGLGKKEAHERAIDMLKLVGIPIPDQRVDEYPHQLSGGMRQRVMIAMALACDPKLLIADEPTTALDVTIQAQILELLQKLREELNMAIILITHDLGVVAETCDRMIVMYAGQVYEEGTAAEVFRNPINPYSEGLMRSIPKLGTESERLAVIPGLVPNPTDWPHGCRFHARCPYGWELCVEREPPEFRPGTLRRNRCWLEENPDRREEIRRRTGGFTDQGVLTGTGKATEVAGSPDDVPDQGGEAHVPDGEVIE